MNDAQRAHLLKELLAGRETLARRWYEASGHERWRDRGAQATFFFVPMVERFLTLLLEPTPDPEAERWLGNELAAWCEGPEELIRSQELLSHYLDDYLSAEETKALQPRLMRLFGEMAIGFYEKKPARESSLLARYFGHGLRTSLCTPIGHSRVLLRGIDGPLNDLQKKDITSIYRSGQQLLLEVDHLIDLSKFEADKMELDFETVDVAHLASCFQIPNLDRIEQQLEIRYEENIGTIYGDPVRIRQVVWNLLGHLAKYGSAGSTIRVSVSRETIDAKEWLCVRIVSPDACAGLEAHRHLFAQGMELANVLASQCELPLVISHLLTYLMGGRIEVESGEGQESTVTLTIPVDKPAEPERRLTRPPLILILEGNEPQGEQRYETYLTAAGYRAMTYQDPRAMIEAARELRPALILVELELEEMSGFEVMQLLRLHPRIRSVRSFLCSTQPKSEIEQQARQEGVYPYDLLQSPVPRDELLALVQRYTHFPPTAGD